MSRFKRRIRSRSILHRLFWLMVQLLLAAILLSFLLILPWAWLPVPLTSFMMQTAWRSRQPISYHWTPYDTISPYLPLAAIAAEDQRFPEHNGFDFVAIEQALEDYQQGETLRGASTISQQVAKNLYLWSGQSFIRKGLEAWFTILIEQLWSKQRILEVYLNIAQFGDRVFGVEAASQQFFGQSAFDLSLEAAALLAAVLPAPELYQVDAPDWEVVQRQDWILQQMEQLGGVEYLRTLK